MRALTVASKLLLLAPLPFVAVAAGILPRSDLSWLTTWGTTTVFVAGAMLCFARVALRPRERAAWTLFGIACSCWSVANLYYAIVVAPGPIHIPSVADLGYVTFPVVLAAGFFQLARTRQRFPRGEVALDGLLVGLSVAAVAAGVVFGLVSAHTNNFAAVVTTLLYPIEDVVVFGCVAGLVALTSRPVGRAWVTAVLAVPLILVSDTIAFSQVLSGSGLATVWPNAGWAAAIALIAVAAWQPQSAPVVVRAPASIGIAVPVAAMVVAVGVLVGGEVFNLAAAAIVLAALAALVAVVRLARAFQQLRLLADSRRLALTDELTGLPNRRRLLADLAAVCNARQPRLLALFDLDGFKSYNDSFGHPAGDELLTALSAGLAASVPRGGRAYRLGGDEFCVLAPPDDEHRWLTAATAALTARGAGWAVASSYGVVDLPTEADDVSGALRIADSRMYAQKARRPIAARAQARDVLLTALVEQQPGLHVHTLDVTSLVAAVARVVGLDEDQIDDTVRAAELHDIGKLAIPSAILNKPGPLDDAEWAIIRRHTLIGERMLLSAPALASVAPLVRSSHERWDGGGYPDGLSGDQIPLGARIVAVCDSYDAIVTDRVYRPGRSSAEAVTELRRCAGTQFDPDVVSAFCAALEDLASAPSQQR